jgi:DNA-binding CsgD family transcriptional regulator
MSDRARQTPPAGRASELPEVGSPAGLAAWRLDLGNGQEFALFELAAPGNCSRVKGITAAERVVLGLAAAGLSNAQIAARRGVSPRTVANQIASAFRKLGVRSRLELEARLARDDRTGDGIESSAHQASGVRGGARRRRDKWP